MPPLTPSRIFSAIMLVVIGIAVARAFLLTPSASSIAQVRGEHRLTGTIVDVNTGETTAGLVLDDIEVDGKVWNDRALVRVPRYPASGLGDRVTVTCDIERPQPIDGFAYDKYLAARDIYATCFTNDLPLLVAAHVDRSLRTDLAKLRLSLTNMIGRAMPEPQATLLNGLLFGVADFSDVWRDRFIATGTSHVVAASGFNVAMVTLVLFHLLTTLGIRRQRTFPLLLIGILLYVMLAGLSPAVVRAGVMGGLVLSARQIGRKTTMRNVVLLTVAAILTVNPLMLWDIGFQLSVVSTTALIWLAPHIAKHFLWVPENFGMREALVGSLAATLCTLPIVIASFGQVSLVSPFINMLILPLVPYAMGFGAIGLLAGVIYEPIGPLVMLPTWTLLTVTLDILSAVATLPFAALTIPETVRYALAAVTTALVIVVWYLVSRSRSGS